MAQLQLSSQNDPIFIELSGAGLRHVLELEPALERVFVVGSSRQADVFVDVAGVAAVEFHLERLGNEIWLTPAYRGRGIVVNGERRREGFQINAAALMLRFGGYELALRLLAGDEDRGPATRSESAPRRLPNDYSLSLPTDTEKTAFAIPASMLDAGDTAPISIPRAGSALPVQRTERLVPVVVAPILDIQETQQIVPVLAPPSLFFSDHTDTTPSCTPPVQESPLASEATTTFYVPAVRAATPDSQQRVATAVAVNRADALRPVNALSVAPSINGFKSLLSQLGLAAKARPLLVLGGALAMSLVLALALVGATRLSHPTRPAVIKKGQAPQTSTPRRDILGRAD